MSTINFSERTISDIPSAGSGSSSSTPANIHRLTNIEFKDPTTPQTLQAALEIKEVSDHDDSIMPVVEEIPDLVGDELPTIWVPTFFNIII